MLRIVNNDGNEMIRLHDNGHEEVKDHKLKEQMEQAKINESKKE